MSRKQLPRSSWVSITGLIAGSMAFGLPGSARADEDVTVQLAGGISTDNMTFVRFDRSAPRPTEAKLTAAHLAAATTVGPLAEAERQFCRLAALES